MTSAVDLGEAGSLAYRSAGSGRPLVLLHPGTGLDGSVFFPEVLTLIECGARVVAIDLPAETPERYWPVVARWLEETASKP